jgi:hypothetical protein
VLRCVALAVYLHRLCAKRTIWYLNVSNRQPNLKKAGCASSGTARTGFDMLLDSNAGAPAGPLVDDDLDPPVLRLADIRPGRHQ